MNPRLLLAPLAAALLAAVTFFPTSATAAKPCSASSLVISAAEEPGGGAAGSFYYRIEFTNLSSSTCTLTGTPKVSAVDLRGRRIGAVAGPEPGTKAKAVRLAPGNAAIATLRITDALDFPKAKCDPTYAAGLRVTVPGGSGAKVAPLPFMTCAATATPTLGIAPVTTVAATD